MTIRVRFAPSPTGYLHVGGARTALFNWVFARRRGGKFILRIEDTDTARSTPEMTEGILRALQWMGLDWDEGPYFQSERLDRHRACAMRLLEADRAYYCFCPPEELAAKRQRAQESKTDWKYDRTCFHLDPGEAARRRERGEPAALRFRIPAGAVEFSDGVFGVIRQESRELEDFVLLRSDGGPTYQLSVVADDLDMRVTHVVRGADHISNTPKQILLYRALDAEPPEFVHVPLILGPDKTRLSKRHGATSVLAYRDQGVLPEAFNNFLALLGWSDGTGREIFDREALIGAFSLAGVSRANAVFNPEKLAWFNGQYIQSLPLETLAERVRPFMEAAGGWDPRFVAERRAWLLAVLALIRSRFRSLVELAAAAAVYAAPRVDYEAAAVERFMREEALAGYLPELADRLEALDPFELAGVERTVRAYADELGVKAALLINASRVALTGQAVAPGIFEVMAVLGREKTVERLRDAARRLWT